VDGFEGPLDFLLEMVRRQWVNHGPLSILALTDPPVWAIEKGSGRIRLEHRAKWLVLASQPLLLKAQLLAPASPGAAEDAGAEARRRLSQLDELARMRAGAARLAARPQLGRALFGRGQTIPPQAAGGVLPELPGGNPRPAGRAEQAECLTARPSYGPSPADLWRISDFLKRIIELLQQHPAGLPPLESAAFHPSRRGPG
jgi:segregation and condensation protein A